MASLLMCDYCVKHEMSPSELFQTKLNVCTSCGTKMGVVAGADMGVAMAAAAPVPQAAQQPKVPAYKPDVDMWSSTEPPEEIREAWAAAAAATTAEDALDKLSAAIKLGCKADDGAVLEDDPEDVAKAAAATAAAVLCAEDQARLYANRATVHLVMGKRMPATNDGRMAAEICPSWWRGHWVKGQAVLMSLHGKGPSSFNAGKAEAAGKSLQAALAAESLPSAQRAAVEAQAEEAKGMLYALNPACAQM